MSEFTDLILNEVKTKYEAAVKADKTISKLLEKIKTAKTYTVAYKYAVRLGDHLAKELKIAFDAISDDEEIYYGSAMQILEPMMRELHNDVASKAVIVQENINANAGMRIKPVKPQIDDFNIRDLARKLSGGAVLSVITEEINHFSQKAVDNTIYDNAEFDNSLGFEITVTRTYDDVGNHDGEQPCEFCLSREGTKVFKDWSEAAGDEIFQRHAGCECTIEYERSGQTSNIVKNYKRKNG